MSKEDELAAAIENDDVERVQQILEDIGAENVKEVLFKNKNISTIYRTLKTLN